MAGSPIGSQHGDPRHYQNVITCSFYCLGPLHKISLQSVTNFLSNVANRQPERQQKDRQTIKQTSATENRTSFVKEVIMVKMMTCVTLLRRKTTP